MTILGTCPKCQKPREKLGGTGQKVVKKGSPGGSPRRVFPLESPHENHFWTRKNDENVKNAKNDTF